MDLDDEGFAITRGVFIGGAVASDVAATLPAAEARAPASTAPSPGGETILVVDDDGEVRTLACRVLWSQDYVVLEAATPYAALAICEQRKGPIDLLLTDVVMPVMSGRELVERVRPMRPEAMIMYMSGYPADVIGTLGVLVSGGFVQKPFTPSGLVETVRDVFRT